MSVQTKSETKATDLVARILEVDLAVARQYKFPPVKEGDHVVGVMSENLERLFCKRKEVCETSRKSDAEVMTFGLDHVKLHSKGKLEEHDCSEFQKQLEEMSDKALAQAAATQNIDDVFWGMVRFEFPELAHKADIGIREGGQVVWTEEEGRGGLRPGLKDLRDLAEALGLV